MNIFKEKSARRTRKIPENLVLKPEVEANNLTLKGRGGFMNPEQFSGQWNFIKGKVKEKWGKITDSDLTKVAGKRDQLVGMIQHHYGLAKEEAEKELSEWEKTLKAKSKQ